MTTLKGESFMDDEKKLLIWSVPQLYAQNMIPSARLSCAKGTLASGTAKSVAQCRMGNGDSSFCALGTGQERGGNIACDSGVSPSGTSWGCADGQGDSGSWNYGGGGLNCNTYGGGIGEVNSNGCAAGDGAM
jgi:hypothetical protein